MIRKVVEDIIRSLRFTIATELIGLVLMVLPKSAEKTEFLLFVHSWLQRQVEILRRTAR